MVMKFLWIASLLYRELIIINWICSRFKMCKWIRTCMVWAARCWDSVASRPCRTCNIYVCSLSHDQNLLHEWSMELILDGNPEVGAQVRNILCYLICLRHLIRSRAVTNWIFSPKRPFYLHAFATYSELPSNICTMKGMRHRPRISL